MSLHFENPSLAVNSQTALLRVNNLHVEFHTQDGILRAVDGVSFGIQPGETLGMVGESGSGKSITLLSVMGLVPTARVTQGSIAYQGQALLGLSQRQMRRLRGKEMAMVFQEPMTSLNPVLKISRQMGESLQLHMGMTSQQARQRSIEWLERVGIPGAAERVDHYPHQFSGGMRQRVMIAMALSCQPRLLIADEPTTALDVTIQAQMVDLVRQLKQDLGMAVLWITHDLALLAGLADRILVMYAGRVVESAALRDLYYRPRHPYTQGLLQSLPRIDAETEDGSATTKLQPIPGSPPNLLHTRSGCAFAPRCRHAIERCWHEDPWLQEVLPAKGSRHQVACWVQPQASLAGE